MTEIIKVVKASFKDCSIENRKKFHKSSCLIPISVGQMVHEGEKFVATVELIDRYFKECTILIDDTIQRHTMKILDKRNDSELYDEALRLGDEWLTRNRQVIDTLSIPYTIIRWDSWVNNENYAAYRLLIENAYNQNNDFKSAIISNITTFLSRYQTKNDINFDYDQAFLYCLEYLKEECACMCLWALKGYEFEVYPTGRNEAMAKTYELFIKPKFPELLTSVSLRFKKYIKKELKNLAEV